MILFVKNSIRLLKIFFCNLVITLLIIIATSSCGFKVIYKENDNSSKDSYVNELASIRIKKDRDQLSQKLKNNLYDILNPNYIEIEPKYLLILSIKESNTPTFITLSGSSGRNKITITVDYQLKRLEDAKLIASGSTSVNDNYDISDNRYGTYTIEEYTKTNLTKLVAQNIRNSLVNDLTEESKK